jgi:hypothetical protein
MPVAVHLTFLGNPEWQGVGALVAIVTIILTVIFELRRRRNKELGASRAREPARPVIAPSTLYDLSTDAGEIEYYRMLSRSTRNAKSVIYRSGRGFSGHAKDSFAHALIEAEDFALNNGVRIVRFQTSDRTSKDWADRYASLIEKYPGQLNVYADFKDPLLVNLGLIDPDGKNPEIQILFESLTSIGHASFADAGLSIDGQARFARSLREQFEDRINKLVPLDAEQVRDLARSYLYFAYGSNMSLNQMRQRCQTAERMGRGIAYGWRRNFAVPAPHFGPRAAAAGIERSENESDYIEGVVYDLTALERDIINEFERGGYRPEPISFKYKGQHLTGFTHVPVVMDHASNIRPPDWYIQTMIEGATANGMRDLVTELRNMISDTQ